MLQIIIFIAITVITLLFAEILSYIFHRFLFHKNYFTNLRYYHLLHHKINDDAWHDYLVMLLVLLIMTIITVIITIYLTIPIYIAVYVILLSLCYFTANYYIHRAYHTPQHYLFNYDWFKFIVSYHQLHHQNPRVNYGILSPLADCIFNTCQWPTKTV